MIFERLMQMVFDQADVSVRKRRRMAYDEEAPEAALKGERASVDSILEIIQRALGELGEEEADELLDRLGQLCVEGGDVNGHMGIDRRRAKDREMGVFERTDPAPFERDRAEDRRRRRHALDAAPTGVKPASERFKNIGTVTVLGADRLTA